LAEFYKAARIRRKFQPFPPAKTGVVATGWADPVVFYKIVHAGLGLAAGADKISHAVPELYKN
jgi:hypothetical protein